MGLLTKRTRRTPPQQFVQHCSKVGQGIRISEMRKMAMTQNKVYLFLGTPLNFRVKDHRQHERLDGSRRLKRSVKGQSDPTPKLVKRTVSIPAE